MLLERTADGPAYEQIWRRTEARATYSGLGFREYMAKFMYNIDRQNRLAVKEKDFRKKMRRHLEIQDQEHLAQENNTRADPAGARLLKKKMHSVKSTGRRLERERADGTKRTDREDDVDFFLADMPRIPNSKEVIRVVSRS